MLFSNSIIKREGSFEIGRIGGFFNFLEEPGVVYGISNNHVIANLNECAKGDSLCNDSDESIGTLTDWIVLKPEKNDVEFALMKINADQDPKWFSWGKYINKKPEGFIAAAVNMNVIYPSEARIAAGSIVAINYPVKINWFGIDYLFTNCIKIQSTDENQFSDHGDSGGAIFSNDNKLVGIIVGIKDDRTANYAIPFIGGILNYCDLQING